MYLAGLNSAISYTFDSCASCSQCSSQSKVILVGAEMQDKILDPHIFKVEFFYYSSFVLQWHLEVSSELEAALSCVLYKLTVRNSPYLSVSGIPKELRR